MTASLFISDIQPPARQSGAASQLAPCAFTNVTIKYWHLNISIANDLLKFAANYLCYSRFLAVVLFQIEARHNRNLARGRGQEDFSGFYQTLRREASFDDVQLEL